MRSRPPKKRMDSTALQLAGRSPRSSPHHAPGQPPTLLDITLERALFDVVESLLGRVNKTSTLHQFATRAVFTGTAALANRQLLQILIPTAAVETGGFDSKQVRHWRSHGKERSQKLNTLRGHCLFLLRSQKIPNSEVVRGWAFAVIHAAALAAVHDANDEQRAVLQQGLEAAPAEVVAAIVAQARITVTSILDENNASAQQNLERGNKRALVDTFLHHAAREVIAAMDDSTRQPMTSERHLLDVVYPEFDRYGDPMSLTVPTAYDPAP